MYVKAKIRGVLIKKSLIDAVIDSSIIQNEKTLERICDEADRLTTRFAKLLNKLADKGIVDKDDIQSILGNSCIIKELTKI